MKKFELYGPPRYSWLPAATRITLTLAGVGLFSAAMLTAGPGNGYQAPHAATHVTLPTVVIVGRQEAPLQQVVASASRHAVRSISTHAVATP
jgi:hypothetical protein